ncbi:ABC-2 type transport system permease protein [Oceanobacillus limi]|uniref:ABC-2 type transport system permease protein n=1 Tax=Oceanobacillus limi TaxID=930131 RepID=A0A1H9Y8L5_9BACI|nr:ABC transporter permease [Oceanobacillus limi]SES65271.1 ABC-2 type transport system permease protein [Oceanobacillus limi]
MQWFNLFNANIRKEYIELKRYLPNTLAMLFTFYFVFLGMFFGIQVIGDPSVQDINTQYAIVNYVFWFLTIMVIQDIGWQVINEGMRDTLEQLSMSPMGIWKIMTTRLLATTLLNFIIVVFLLFLSMLTTGQWLNIDVGTLLPILLLTLISMFGIGFIIAGISIVLKQVQAFLQILQFILAGLTFVPLTVAPFLAFFPFVKGVDLVRSVMIDGVTLSQIQATDWAILSVNAVVYFVLGLFIFLYCERFAMKRGLLAHY